MDHVASNEMFMQNDGSIQRAFDLAAERYASLGVNVAEALEQLSRVAISVHCWQGDDVAGFEGTDAELGSGLAVTGNYPGRARTVDELRSDLEVAYSLIPGRHRLNLHALYGEFSGPVDRDEIAIHHFSGWMEWAAEQGLKLDFNPSYFTHEKAAEGMTLAHSDASIREFWIAHGIASRRIAAAMGSSQNSPAMNNIWVPDGMKDTPADRTAPRERLADSLDQIFAEALPSNHLRDAVECKLFGIGSESYVVGSHEFYLGYATTRGKVLCLDAGHFHPTEVVSDKLSSVLMFVPEVLLHVSRGVRWDSDHVVTYSDELQALMQEVVRGQYLNRVQIGLDFFDASINRVAAWAIGTRNVLKALLAALLEPTATLKKAELSADYTTRLALMEEMKSMPFGAIWDYYCVQNQVPVGAEWLSKVKRYEAEVQLSRSDTLIDY